MSKCNKMSKPLCLAVHHEAMSSFAATQLIKAVNHLCTSNSFSLAHIIEIIGIIAAASQAALPADAPDKATLAESLSWCARCAVEDFCNVHIELPDLN